MLVLVHLELVYLKKLLIPTELIVKLGEVILLIPAEGLLISGDIVFPRHTVSFVVFSLLSIADGFVSFSSALNHCLADTDACDI
jgi:hypothetical protein